MRCLIFAALFFGGLVCISDAKSVNHFHSYRTSSKNLPKICPSGLLQQCLNEISAVAIECQVLVITFVLFFQLCLLKTTTKTNIRYSTSVMNNVLSISSSDLIMCIQGLKFEYYVRFVLILFVISFKCSKLRNFQHIIAY